VCKTLAKTEGIAHIIAQEMYFDQGGNGIVIPT
jgi:hypothetical protein